MSFRHGVYKSEIPTSVIPPAIVDVGLPVVIGTAPINIGNIENVNKPKLIFNYAEAVKEFGFTNNFKDYTLSEFIYSQFVLFGNAPCVLINVLDPEKHVKEVTSRTVVTSKNKALIEEEGILVDDLKVTLEGTELKLGEDFAVTFNDEGHLIITLLKESKETVDIELSYSALEPSLVTSEDIIGGIDLDTGEKKGLELIGEIYPRFRKIPGLLLSPKFSKLSEVAAILDTKKSNINGIFNGEALIDADDTKIYSEVAQWKNDNNIVSSGQFLCYPKLKLGDKEFHFSTQLAGLINTVDRNNGGIPYESPSNKNLKCDSCVSNGKEVFLGLEEANYLNSQGIVTALNFMNGWVAWGNRTAAYPSDTDPKESFIPIRRMFNYVGNTLITTFWSKIDNPNNKRLIETVIDSANIWLNSLVAEGALLGARVAFLSEENSVTSMMDGKLKFHVYMTPVGPAEEIDFVQEYDVEYVNKFIQELGN